MVKILSFTILALLVVGILLDPCTFRVSAAHTARAAPWWQLAFSSVDIALIATAAAYAQTGRHRVAIRILLVETIYNLVVSIGLMNFHGLSRFAAHFGHYEGLALYLAWLGLRIGALWMWFEQAITTTER